MYIVHASHTGLFSALSLWNNRLSGATKAMHQIPTTAACMGQGLINIYVKYTVQCTRILYVNTVQQCTVLKTQSSQSPSFYSKTCRAKLRAIRACPALLATTDVQEHSSISAKNNLATTWPRHTQTV